MKIAASYSFSMAYQFINNEYPHLRQEIQDIISSIDAESCRLRVPNKQESVRARKLGVSHFFSIPHLQRAFMRRLLDKGWGIRPRINTTYSARRQHRDLGAVKERLGLQIQFGKHPYVVYDVLARMPIFEQFGGIIAGIEICPMASMIPHMPTGIGCFEDVAWDLSYKGDCDGNDTPVLVLGIEPNEFPSQDNSYAILRGQYVPSDDREVSLEGPIHI